MGYAGEVAKRLIKLLSAIETGQLSIGNCDKKDESLFIFLVKNNQ